MHMGRIRSGVFDNVSGDVVTPALFPGYDLPNRLELVHDGSKVTAWLNGNKFKQLDSVAGIEDGYPCLVVFDEVSDGVQVRFDNITVAN